MKKERAEKRVARRRYIYIHIYIVIQSDFPSDVEKAMKLSHCFLLFFKRKQKVYVVIRVI